MALGINTGGGDFDPYLKYNAKAGRWYTKPDGGGDEYELPSVVGIFDFANIKTGWFLFADGMAPEHSFHPSLKEKSPRPSDKHKEGFMLRVLLSSESGGGVKEFSSTAGGVINEIDAMHDYIEAALEFKAGKLPIVQFTGATPMKTKHGTNYIPTFKVIAWRDRPDELKPQIDDTPAAPLRSSPSFAGGASSRAPAFAGDDLNDDAPFVTNDPMAREPGTSRRGI